MFWFRLYVVSFSVFNGEQKVLAYLVEVFKKTCLASLAREYESPPRSSNWDVY